MKWSNFFSASPVQCGGVAATLALGAGVAGTAIMAKYIYSKSSETANAALSIFNDDEGNPEWSGTIIIRNRDVSIEIPLSEGAIYFLNLIENAPRFIAYVVCSLAFALTVCFTLALASCISCSRDHYIRAPATRIRETLPDETESWDYSLLV